MKKSTILLFLFCLIVSVSFGQTIGIKAGYNQSNTKVVSSSFPRLDEINAEYTSIGGFHIGPTIDIPFSKLLAIESGLLLSSKGNLWEREFGADSPILISQKQKIYYLHIPLSLKAALKIGAITLYGTGGAYLGIGLKAFLQNEDYQNTTDFGNDFGDLNRLDFGLTYGAGVEYQNFSIGVSYDLGLRNTNASPTGSNGVIAFQNRSLNFSVGYRFVKKAD